MTEPKPSVPIAGWVMSISSLGAVLTQYEFWTLSLLTLQLGFFLPGAK